MYYFGPVYTPNILVTLMLSDQSQLLFLVGQTILGHVMQLRVYYLNLFYIHDVGIRGIYFAYFMSNLILTL